MGKLIFSAIMSLDGFVADEAGKFDWAEPDEEVHTFVNELERQVGTYLFGRKMYEVMSAWENAEAFAEEPAYVQEFASIWQAADKIVYSRTLGEPSTARTRVEREFDPEEVRRLKAESDRDLSIGGPTLAAHAILAGLVDEYQLFLAPVVIGRGLAAFPDFARVELELLGERRFGNGMVYLRYRERGAANS